MTPSSENSFFIVTFECAIFVKKIGCLDLSGSGLSVIVPQKEIEEEDKVPE
jgi:hypothetical protein